MTGATHSWPAGDHDRWIALVDDSQFVRQLTVRPHALRQAIHCCRKGGTLSVPGVYGGLLDKLNRRHQPEPPHVESAH